MTNQYGPKPVRRIVTGHTDDGRSMIVSDGPSPNVFVSEDIAGFGSIVPWLTEPGDVSNDGNDDAATADTVVPMYPKAGGTVFRIASFPPDTVYSADATSSMFESFDGEHARDAVGGAADNKHFWFHRTDSLDYAIVLEGEVWLLTDEDETLARPGDVIIQRGTSHAWSNRTDQICRVAFILVGALPVTSVQS